MPWDSVSFRGWKDKEDPAEKTEMKWPMREEENKREWWPRSQVEEGFKVEGLINRVKIG